MSREMYFHLSEGFVIARCQEEKIGISAIQSLACGGTRLVCMSVDGAETMRRKLKKNLMKSDPARERHGPGWGFVARS
jgi:hypothetical protein